MTWYSQAGQDAWVHDLIGDSGYFVDVGAHDGVVHSNTYALEQRGWTGVCIEPDPTVIPQLESNRSCHAIGYAISNERGAVTIRPSGVLVAALTLAQLLPLCDAPPIIDYLSIDVEGHELEVLAGMDFDRWHVRLATIEHNVYCDGPGRKDAIAAVMVRHGFECYADDIVAPGYGEYESWWVHRDH